MFILTFNKSTHTSHGLSIALFECGIKIDTHVSENFF